MLDRRAQLHLTNLASDLSQANPALSRMMNGASQALKAHGNSAAGATQQAYALLQSTVQRQATMLSYIDCFWFLGVAIMLMVPAVFLIKKTKAGGGMAVH
jgi:DHA2 family multidrug resistance protein